MPTIPMLGKDGVISSLDETMVGVDAFSYAQDAMIRDGMVMPVHPSRLLDGASGSVPMDVFDEAFKATFAVNNKTVIGWTSKAIPISHSSGYSTGASLRDAATGNVMCQFTTSTSPVAPYRPACVYRDELIFCRSGPSGALDPIVRFSGAELFDVLKTGDCSIAQGTGVLTYVTAGIQASDEKGGYVYLSSPGPTFPAIHHRLVDITTPSSTLEESVYQTAAVASTGFTYKSWGLTYPAMRTPSNGSVTKSGTTITGLGTSFNLYQSGDLGRSILVARSDGVFEHMQGSAVTSTSITGVLSATAIATGVPYIGTSTLAFADCCTHQASLCGVGYVYDRQALFVGPPDWNLSFPPGFPLPFDPSAPAESYNAGEFLMDRIPIQNTAPDDYAIGVISTPDALYVANADSLVEIDGVWPSFRQRILARGIGMLNPEAKVSIDRGGVFFAGPRGVYALQGGQWTDITAGRIDTEYVNVIRGMTDPVVKMGVAHDTLIVTAEERGSTDADDSVTWHYDIARGVWMGRLTEPTRGSLWFWPSNDELISVDANDRLSNYAAKFEHPNTQTAPEVGQGYSSMEVHTGASLSTSGRPGIDDEALVTEIDADVYCYNGGSGAAGTLQFQIESSGGDDDEGSSTTTAVEDSTVDLTRTDRQRMRFQVNAFGVWHKLIIRENDSPTSARPLGYKAHVGRVTIGVMQSASRS